MTYTIFKGNIFRDDDGALLPNDPENRDWQTYQQWLAEGNSPAENVSVSVTDVDNYRDVRLAAGFSDPVTGQTFQCDPDSRGFWTALGASAGMAALTQSDVSFPLITASNQIVTLDAQETYALINTRILVWVSATVLFARQLKSDILAGNPPADITADWP